MWKTWLSQLLASAIWGVAVGLAASILLAPAITAGATAAVATADAVASGLALALWVKLQRQVGWWPGLALGALGGGLLQGLTLAAARQGDWVPAWFVYSSLAFPAALGTLGFNLRPRGDAEMSGQSGK